MGCCSEDVSSEDDDNPDKVPKCTDSPWLFALFSFWLVMTFVAVIAFVYGNPLRLVNGYDTFGNICGFEGNEEIGNLPFSGMNMSSKKYLFYMDYSNIQQSLQICVEQCPDKDLESVKDLERFYNETGSFLCRYDANFTTFLTSVMYVNSQNDDVPFGSDDIITSLYGPCPVLPVVKSYPVLNRCVPEPAKGLSPYLISNMYGMLNSWTFFEEILSDLYQSWSRILVLTLLSLVLSLAVVCLLHFFADTVSWMILSAVAVLSVASTVILWWTYIDIKCELNNTPSESLLDEAVKNEEAFLWYAIISSTFMVLLPFLIFVLRKYIPRLSPLFKEASNCLAELPALHLLPLMTFSLLTMFYTFWINVVVHLATASYPGTRKLKPYAGFSTAVYDPNATVSNLPMNFSIREVKSFTAVEYVDPLWIKYMSLLYFIGLLWVSEFILACQKIAVSGSVAKWYFNRNYKTSGSAVMSSVGNLIAYHLGSAAKGSILISIFKVPRIILSWLYCKNSKKNTNNLQDENAEECCFFSCWDKFLKYVNHNAYTVVIIQDIDFCPAAYRAWLVSVDNKLKLSTINRVGDVVLFLSKCLVTLAVSCIAVLIFKRDLGLHFYAVPTLVLAVFSFYISHAVISLHELVIDTLVLCLYEDREINDNAGYWKQSLLCANQTPRSSSIFPIEPTRVVEL